MLITTAGELLNHLYSKVQIREAIVLYLADILLFSEAEKNLTILITVESYKRMIDKDQ